MEETLKQNLFRLAQMMSYRGFTERQIGYASIKNYLFFTKLHRGEGFTVRSYDRIVQWISDNWSEDLVWPANIDRPVPTPKEA